MKKRSVQTWEQLSSRAIFPKREASSCIAGSTPSVAVKHNDERLYSFFNADQIIDFLLSIGMKPFVELSFMPTALASASKTVFHYRGNVTPTADYQQWSMLIHTLVGHWVDRYGIREVAEWFFEVWNEPNLKAFWTGTRKDYFKLYRVTAHAIKEIDPSLKVGEAGDGA